MLSRIASQKEEENDLAAYSNIFARTLNLVSRLFFDVVHWHYFIFLL